MPNPYVQVLRTPGGLGLTGAGFLARLPLSMASIALLLLVADLTGSYAVAGVVNAGWILSNAVFAPALARLVDRRGQTRVVAPQVAAHVAGVALVLALAAADSPVWVLFGAVVVAGALMPVVGSLVRARWGYVLGSDLLLRSAYSWESVVDEVLFVVGPVLVTFIVVGVGPAAALAITTAIGAVGAVALLAQRGSEPPPATGAGKGSGSVLAHPGMAALAIVTILLGVTFAGVEITVIADARTSGQTERAGIVLSVWAVSSMLSALTIGAVSRPIVLRRQLLVSSSLLVITLLPLLVVEGLLAYGVVLFVAGLAVSPALIACFALARELVPADRLTEALSWISVGISVGFSLGSPATGWLVDHSGPEAGFWVAIVAAASTVLSVASSYASLARPAE